MKKTNSKGVGYRLFVYLAACFILSVNLYLLSIIRRAFGISLTDSLLILIAFLLTCLYLNQDVESQAESAEPESTDSPSPKPPGPKRTSRLHAFGNRLSRLFSLAVAPSQAVTAQVGRDIETRGCMATDYAVREGTIIGRVMKPVDNGGVKVPTQFSRLQLPSGEIIEHVTAAAYRATDGALEWRY